MQNSETEADAAPVSDDSQFTDQPESEAQAPADAPTDSVTDQPPEPADAETTADAEAVDEITGDSDDSDEAGDGNIGEDAEDDEAEDAGSDEPALPLMSVVEAVLFAAREPLKLVQVARAAGKRIRQEAVRTAIDELNLVYLDSGRAFEIAEVSGRYQLMSRPEYARHIMRLYPKRELTDKDKTPKLTPAALETLTIIAYKQPVTRGEIEHIRGVGCGQTIRTLMERGSVLKKGKREDLIGQPPTYVTTDAFLVEFGLGSLDELPMRHEIVGMFGAPLPSAELEAEPAEPAEPVDTDIEPSTEPETEEPEEPEATEATGNMDKESVPEAIPPEQDSPQRKEDAFPEDFS